MRKWWDDVTGDRKCLDETRCEDIGGCKVRGLDDGLACTGFEDKLRERRAKRISSDSDAL